MPLMDETIRELQAINLIPLGGQAYDEVFHGLVALGLNPAFFVLTPDAVRRFSRTLADGRNLTCPVMTIYLKFDDDFTSTGIDSHWGNWDDKWRQTVPVRNLVNATLRRHGFDEEHVSEHTFVFVHSLERLSLLEIGKRCKTAVADLVRREVPGCEISQVFWTSNRTFHVIMRDKVGYKRVKKVKQRVERALPDILKAADLDGYCRTYPAALEVGSADMNLFHLIREGL